MHLPPRTEFFHPGGAMMRCLPRPLHLSHRERSKSSFMISGEGFSPSSCPHPESRALSCRLHDGIRSCPSDQTSSCDGVTSSRGFSLIELAIVLVILGLLAGGILAGQSLIRSAEVRSVLTDFDRYRLALIIFQERYTYLPGDMPNATIFWGAMTVGTCPNATGGTGTQTCNGNGDGIITDGSAGVTEERFTFWQHLANAGMIEGNYTGIAGPLSRFDAIIGQNIPRSKIQNTGFSFDYSPHVTGDINDFPRASEFGSVSF